VMAKLRCAAGLAAMDSKKYKQAALRFTEASTLASNMAAHAPTQCLQHVAEKVDACTRLAQALTRLRGTTWQRAGHMFCTSCSSPERDQHAAQASAELGSQWSDVIAQQDVATYGGLCALATLSRTELRSRVIDNIQFREFLEVVPEVGTSVVRDICISSTVK